MALFQQALTMWSPFAAGATGVPFPGMPKPPIAASASNEDADKDEQLAKLRQQMEAMQRQLDAMARKPGT